MFEATAANTLISTCNPQVIRSHCGQHQHKELTLGPR